MGEARPTSRDAMRIAESYTGRKAVAAQRFPSGLANYVFEVWTDDGRSCVVRLSEARQRGTVVSATYWYRLLAPLGVPLPRLLAFDANPAPSAFPYTLLERLPGQDLGEVYPSLSSSEKRRLAGRIVEIQEMVGQLPLARGYGYARSYIDADLESTWMDVVRAELARSRARLRATRVATLDLVDRLEEKLATYRGYLNRIPPTAFLDDTTTKNVIIDDGRLSGIVDVDCVCFGDGLFTVALTRTSLLNSELPTDYIDFWCEALQLDEEQRRILDLYTAMFCLGFLSEYGQRFNKDAAMALDWDNVRHLLGLFEALLDCI